MAKTLEFFFFYGSIHTYLPAMRIERAARAAGVALVWRPFNLRAILVEQNNTAFARNPVRLAYNWRDIERRAARLGIAFNGKPPYPVDPDLLALRVGAIAAAEGWCADCTTATFRAWFLDKKLPGTAEHVAEILVGLGRAAPAVIAQARAPATDDLVAAATAAARTHGIFGSPTFAVGGEIFWGDDRLDDAIEWAARN
jgi:2-hydroxychromene-2-carboxylate isomerase